MPDSANDMLAPQSWVAPAIAQALGPDQLLLMGSYRIVGTPAAPQYRNSLLALRRQDQDAFRAWRSRPSTTNIIWSRSANTCRWIR